MSDAIYLRDECQRSLTAVAAVAAGEIYQMADGRAGVYTGQNAAAIGDKVGFTTEGIFTVAKTASKVVIDGAPLWWDHSANSCTPVPPLVTGDRDFYLGTAVGDATAAATTCAVNLNVRPVYEVDLHTSGGDTAIVKTNGAVAAYNRGGSLVVDFTTDTEAQKADWLSKRNFTIGSNWILEAVLEVTTNGDADVVDVTVGVASGTHASDFQSVAEFAAFHLDPGNDLYVYAESDDGTTDVAPTNTTVAWAAGTPVHLVIDGRDPTDIQYYVNGVNVLPATTFTLTAASGPLYAIFHAEKSSNDSPFACALDMLRVRTAQQ